MSEPMRGETYQRRHDAPPRALSDGDLATVRATLDARRYVDWYDIECLLLTIVAAREEGRRSGLEEAANAVARASVVLSPAQATREAAYLDGLVDACEAGMDAIRALAKAPR